MVKQLAPVSQEEMAQRGIGQLDFVYVCGDAYVDHPSFGHAIIIRVLEEAGFTVGMIAQPSWQDTTDFMQLSRPKYAFLVSAGNMDSMVNHYTVNKKPRSSDLYSPGGSPRCRPDRATVVYCNCIRQYLSSLAALKRASAGLHIMTIGIIRSGGLSYLIAAPMC